jgi:CBS domain-containing protein
MVLMVRDIMTVGVPTCPPDTLIIELIEVMVEKSLEGMVVQNFEGHAIGYISRAVLIKAYAAGNFEEMKAEEIMINELPQLPPDIPITTAAQMMIDMNVRVVYMTHRAGGIEYPAALVTYDHIISHMANKDGAPPKTVGIQAERKSPIDLFIERRDAAILKNRPKNKQGE